MSDENVLATLDALNRAWLEGRPDDMRPWIHPDITFVFPGFAGRIQGSEIFLSGFKDFCEHARVESFQESDHQADVTGETAVASFRFDVVYERDGSSYRSKGRDLWVFSRQQDRWLAVWRTMLDVAEEPA
jgi:ketosteroid isomerase-like protein